MPPPTFALLLALSTPALSMCAAGLAIAVFALFVAKTNLANSRGIHRIAALTPICFAIPLAVFGAEHLASHQALAPAVPSYMPWHLFWVYFVGFALIAASLSIAAARQVQWSGLLFGLMMFLFVAMLHLPGAIRAGGRIPWTIVFREMSFGGGACVLAAIAVSRAGARHGQIFRNIGRVLIAITAIFFGVQHFLHPFGLPGVPLEKQMPPWVPARPAVDYITGAALIIAGVCFLLARKTRLASAYVGAWIVFLVLVIYTPVLIAALANPNPGVQVEGINYFADTLLFGGVILSLSGVNRAPEV